MKRLLIIGALLVSSAVSQLTAFGQEAAAHCNFNVGVGQVDITPTESVTLAGSPHPQKSSSVETRLFARAVVMSAGSQRLAMVTLDSLKYPTDLAVQARKQVEEATSIPANNIIICTSHTHSGPLWAYYQDKLVTPIREAVVRAVYDLSPCAIGTATGSVEGISENRRLLIDGEAWNTWQLKPSEKGAYPAAGPADPELNVLAAISENGRYKAILYNYACHAANTRDTKISADYPGHVQEYVKEHLGYDVPTFFLAGACGDINPNYTVKSDVFAEQLGQEILSRLPYLPYIVKPTLRIETRKWKCLEESIRTSKNRRLLASGPRNWNTIEKPLTR